MSTLSVAVSRRYSTSAGIEARLEVPLDPPDVTVLFGPSGSGKTTLLRCIAGLERPDAGLVRCGDETWFDEQTEWPPQRRRVGLLSQSLALFPHLTVAQNLAFGMGPQASVGALVGRFGLHGLEERRPAGLSGGEAQRVALARTLAAAPRLLLLDEPLSALDAPTREAMRIELRAHLREARLPALVVTHDRLEALALGDRLVVVVAGQVRQVGPVAQVFSQPADVDVARLVGTENVLSGEVLGPSADGLVEVEVGGRRLVAVDEGLRGRVWVCLRAEEVLLEDMVAPTMSARNQLGATVTAVVPEGALSRVQLDCGFKLVALVTKNSVERLKLEPGHALVAAFKAPGLRLVSRG